MEKVRTAFLASGLFVASMITTLWATDRLDHDGTANIPVVSAFFPEPEVVVECREIVGPSVLGQQEQLAKTEITHPDTVRMEFRPQANGRPVTARVSFKFSYEVEPGLEEHAFDRLTARWADATATTKEFLEQQDVALLTAPHGVEVVQENLIETLNKTLFERSDGKRIAAITQLFWIDWLMQ